MFIEGTAQRPDRDQSEPEGQEESSFWKRELEEVVEAGEVEGRTQALAFSIISQF